MSLGVEQIAADAESYLKEVHPSFDISDKERMIVIDTIQEVQTMLSGCMGDKRAFIQALNGMNEVVLGGMDFVREVGQEMAKEDPAAAEDLFERFNNQLVPELRKRHIQEAVNAAMYLALERESGWYNSIKKTLRTSKERMLSLMGLR